VPLLSTFALPAFAEDALDLPDTAEAPAVRRLIDRFRMAEKVERVNDGTLRTIHLRGLPELEKASFRMPAGSQAC